MASALVMRAREHDQINAGTATVLVKLRPTLLAGRGIGLLPQRRSRSFGPTQGARTHRGRSPALSPRGAAPVRFLRLFRGLLLGVDLGLFLGLWAALCADGELSGFFHAGDVRW